MKPQIPQWPQAAVAALERIPEPGPHQSGALAAAPGRPGPADWDHPAKHTGLHQAEPAGGGGRNGRIRDGRLLIAMRSTSEWKKKSS